MTPSGVLVNDIQSQLNATRVNRIVMPASIGEIREALKTARSESRCVSIAGGRHSMGGQQFGADCILLDTTRLNKLISLDTSNGVANVEAGIEWPELISALHEAQAGSPGEWTIREKQTGVDRVTIGGSLTSNVHGRGLRRPPIIGDVESFDLMDANGVIHLCSRTENRELFSLAIGGYGLFGVITRVRLRLARRVKIERIVEIIAVKDLMERAEQRMADGFLYGDCQYSTDLETDADTHSGVFSSYRPVSDDAPVPEDQKQLSGKQWVELYRLARTDKRKAFEVYSRYYLSTSGQTYWSDTHQLAGSFDDYREAVDAEIGTEMIIEVSVSKENFVPLITEARKDFIDHQVDMTYGTIRFIEQDGESFLAWAKQRSVCITCNLHVLHTDEGQRKAIADFRRIIDRAIQFGGRYFLTYSRCATRRQVESCYPQFVEFLRLKKKHDPGELFQSDWYRHYKEMFADKL